MNDNLESDLINSEYIRAKCNNSKEYCINLYSALCNNRFLKNNNEWTCSWRHAGTIIAEILDKGNYLDWYISGKEGFVDQEIRDDILLFGWEIKSYESNTSI